MPDYSVLEDTLLLNKYFDQSYCLYAGIPAKLAKQLSEDYKYFSHPTGYVK